MPYCPDCLTEYEDGITTCADCGAELVSALAEGDQDAPVAVLHASTPGEALVAEATLEAEGIPAFVLTGDPVLPNAGNVDGDSPDLDVMVPHELADEAAGILSEPPMTDEELGDAAESTPAV